MHRFLTSSFVVCTRVLLKFIVFVPVFSVLALCSNGQKLEVAAGINKNKYFDSMKEGRYESGYRPAYGYTIGISLTDIKTDVLPLRLSLVLDHYRGTVYTNTFGLSYSNTTEVDVAKTTLGLEACPLNFTFWKRVQLGIGGMISFRIQDKTKGYQYGWAGWRNITTRFSDSVRIQHNAFFGTVGRLGYAISINNKWNLIPQYRFYIGLTEEFKDTEFPVYSMRHSFEIGIARKLK